jgi:hypothetical protein
MRTWNNHHPLGKPGISPQSHRLLVATGKPKFRREEQRVAVMARPYTELKSAHTEDKLCLTTKNGYRRPQGALTPPGWIPGGSDRAVTRSKSKALRPNPHLHGVGDKPCVEVQFRGKDLSDSKPCPQRKRSMDHPTSFLSPFRAQGFMARSGIVVRSAAARATGRGRTARTCRRNDGAISESSGVLTYRSGREKTAAPRVDPCVQGVAAQVARSIQESGSGPDHIDGGAGHTISNRRPSGLGFW